MMLIVERSVRELAGHFFLYYYLRPDCLPIQLSVGGIKPFGFVAVVIITFPMNLRKIIDTISGRSENILENS